MGVLINPLLMKVHVAVRREMLRKGKIPVEFGLIPSGKSLLTWHRRPLAMPRELKAKKEEFARFGIIVQGPLVERWNFTLETLRGYSIMFPGVKLVLSTWEGTQPSCLTRAEALGAFVISNKKPTTPGPGNFNLQLKSTQAGLKLLNSLGVQFAMKQRTDQRMYSSNSLQYLERMHQFFPGVDSLPRLFSSSLNSFLDREYGLSDMLQFSTLKEVTRFWDVEPVDTVFDLPKGLEQLTETFLTFRYLQSRVAGSPVPSWEDALSQYLGIVDSSALDLIWPKYSRREYLWRRYPSITGLTELSHSAWVTSLRT